MSTHTIALIALTTLTGACATAHEPDVVSPAPAPTARAGHTEINGVRYYHEIHGEGPPLLLLHGGLGSIDMFAPILPTFAAHHQVIAVDLQGHGRTTLGDRAFSLPDIGDDLAILLGELGYDQVDTVGYSLGAGVAFRLAVQHPEKVKNLVLVSGAFARDGFYPEMLPMQESVSGALADSMKDTPMYKSYAAVAPIVEDFPRLLDALGELMRTPYDWKADVARITQRTMLVYGDADMFRLEHAVEFYHLLGGGLRDAGWQREHMSTNRLAILPDVTHYEMFMAPELATTTLQFLDGKAAPSWDAQVAAR